jgi:acyl-coenzyme A thioesterase PaaI-like protein
LAPLHRAERRRQLTEALAQDPLLTDRELAQRLGVSVQTIRLDRLALGIPEVRVRAFTVAERTIERRAGPQVVGELIDLVPGQTAISRLSTDEDMVYGRSERVRGHVLFAQAESLALAVTDLANPAVGLCRVKFRRTVQLGEVLVAKAQVLRRRRDGRQAILVQIRSGTEEVLRAKFVVEEEGQP